MGDQIQYGEGVLSRLGRLRSTILKVMSEVSEGVDEDAVVGVAEKAVEDWKTGKVR